MPRSKIDATDKHVGKQICMRRLMLGMTIEALGNAVGVTYQQMYKCEKGLNRIGASRLQHIAQILEVPIAFFFEGAPVSTKQAASQVLTTPKNFWRRGMAWSWRRRSHASRTETCAAPSSNLSSRSCRSEQRSVSPPPKK
jgi:transcriptional regulator with XRE-family HTH domain